MAVKAAVAETAAAVEVAAVVVAKANAPMAAALVPVAVVANKPLARKVRVVLKAKVKDKDKAQDAVLTAIAPPSVMHNRAATKVGLPVVVAWVNPVHPALPPVANPTLCAPAWI